jgi:hypothetical protein
MYLVPERRKSRALLCLVGALALLAIRPAKAAEKPRLQVDHYDIDAQLIPAKHQLVAHTQVKFTALEDLSVAVFELHNDLRPSRVLDADGKPLSVERVTQDSTIRIALPNGLPKGSSTTLTIDYAGTLESGDNSPVPGLKLAYVGPETLVPGQRLWNQPLYRHHAHYGACVHDRDWQRQHYRGQRRAGRGRSSKKGAHSPPPG